MNKNIIILSIFVLLFSGCIYKTEETLTTHRITTNPTNTTANSSTSVFYMSNETLEKLNNNTLIFNYSQPQPIFKILKNGTSYSNSRIIINKSYVKSIEYQNDEIIIIVDGP